jgi:hypothetical protein
VSRVTVLSTHIDFATLGNSARYFDFKVFHRPTPFRPV